MGNSNDAQDEQKQIALLFQTGYWGDGLVSFWIRRTVRRKLDEDPSNATSFAALGFIVKLGIWAIVILLALDNVDAVLQERIKTDWSDRPADRLPYASSFLRGEYFTDAAAAEAG